jgi:hypothetical protein
MQEPRMNCPRCKSKNQTGARRVARVAGAIIPGMLLAIMPKCPACFAAYATVLTGFGISFTTAAYLRTGAIFLCVAALVFVAFTTAARLLRFNFKA